MLVLSICGVHRMDFLGQGLENSEGFGGVNWHGNVNIFLVVIPVNGQSIGVILFKIHGYFGIFKRLFKRLSASVLEKYLTPKSSNQI